MLVYTGLAPESWQSVHITGLLTVEDFEVWRRGTPELRYMGESDSGDTHWRRRHHFHSEHMKHLNIYFDFGDSVKYGMWEDELEDLRDFGIELPDIKQIRYFYRLSLRTDLAHLRRDLANLRREAVLR